MNFAQALNRMLEGEKITRKEWADSNCYGFFMNEILYIHRDFKFYQWVLTEADVISQDWEVV